jgi:hypothetical protein
VEFHNSFLDHYFVTADPAEAAAIDAGSAGPGWTRTGGRFGVFRGATDAPGLAPVCRFYGRPGVGPNSHFYTSEPQECEQVKHDPGWLYEGIAFHVTRVASGACAAGTTPVYRSYNNGAARNDSNHRFTVDAAAFARSSDYGYLAEGVVMCAALSVRRCRRRRGAPHAPGDLRAHRGGSGTRGHARHGGVGGRAARDAGDALSRVPVGAGKPRRQLRGHTHASAGPGSYCARDNYTLFQLQLQFFRNAVAAPDQLRQRVAWALSQIMVTSGLDNARNYAMRNYQQLLADQRSATSTTCCSR